MFIVPLITFNTGIKRRFIIIILIQYMNENRFKMAATKIY